MRKLIRAYPWAFVVLLGLFLVLFGANIATFYTDWLWFGEVKQRRVFLGIYGTRITLFTVFGLASFLLAYVNVALANRFSPPARVRVEGGSTLMTKNNANRPAGRAIQVLSSFRGVLNGLILLGALVFAGAAGLTAQTHWDDFLRFTHPVAFGTLDPQFGRDIGFYIFTLPFLNYVADWLFVILLLVTAAVSVVYLYQRGIDSATGTTHFAPHVRSHLSALTALVLLVKGWMYYLDRYDLMYGAGVAPGAGYTDIHARLPLLHLIIGVMILAALATIVNIWRRTLILPLIAVGLWLGASGVGVIVPGTVQRFQVKPNEAALEAPYITRAIQSTRVAYDVENVRVENFPAEPTLSTSDLARNRATLDNIRLWDYEPLLETYPQQQGLRQYYGFRDVDVDRYRLGAKPTDYQQVLLAVRELNPEGLDARAQTWPNLHLRYTHGYGAVMSPAGRFTSEGLPEFLMKDVPIVASVPTLALAQPRVYYGIGNTPGTYVVVKTRQKEFDFTKDDDSGGPADRENVYDGEGGIPLSPLAKFAFAARFAGWANLMLASDITSESRLLFGRRVPDRVKRIAPFLYLDRDPYPVVADGRIYWIQDCYTASDAYPYAATTEWGDNLSAPISLNYIRNSVKAVVDAYDGTVALYVTDDRDPLLKSYQRAFPGLFRPASVMPDAIRAHRRVPEDLFSIQRRIIADYHVQDAGVFYARADSWQQAHSQSTVENNAADGSDAMAPYYVLLRLPGQKNEEFVLLSPFTPRDRQNMIALYAARCDGDHYGERVLYRFPSSRTVYGPEQIGKRIRSDAKISPYLSLNDQKGSHVLFGSMLIVPIEKSLLYVQPLYVKARTGTENTGGGASSIPELKQIVVAFENRIAMEPTLGAALTVLFGDSNKTTILPTDEKGTVPAPASAPTAVLVEQATAQYDRAQAALRAGDFAGYGRESKALGETLRQLRGTKEITPKTP